MDVQRENTFVKVQEDLANRILSSAEIFVIMALMTTLTTVSTIVLCLPTNIVTENVKTLQHYAKINVDTSMEAGMEPGNCMDLHCIPFKDSH